MKLSRKNLGRVATTFLATAMLASLTAVPAMAAYDEGASYTDPVTFDQYLKLDADAKAPTISNIDYTIAGVAGVNEDGMPITAGINPESITLTYDGFDPDDLVLTDDEGTVVGEVGSGYVTDQVSMSLSALSFTEPGIYRYSITPVWKAETTAIDGVTLDTATHYLDVYVVDENGTLKVDAVILHMTDATAGNDGNWEEGVVGNTEKATSFVHTYKTNDLTLDKVVSGTMGDKTADFTFTIKVNVEDTSAAKTYTVKYGDNQTKTFTSGSDGATITLKHNQTATIYGLSASDKYEIVETSYANDGYTTAYTVDIAKANEAPENATKSNTASGTMGDAAKNVVFYNDRDAVSPTGIVTNIAPYALLVVIAAAGCFVFLRKRNED